MATSCWRNSVLRLLQARLQFRLLALQRALAAAGFGDLFLQAPPARRLQFGDLVLAAENRRRRFAVAVAVQIAAGVNAVAAEQVAAQV